MIVLGILHLSLVRFSIIVQHGALDTLLCIGRVIRLNTTESVDQVVTLRITSGRFRGQIVDFDNQKIGRVFSCLLYTSPSPRDS